MEKKDTLKTLAYIIYGGSIASLLLWFVGILICLCIVYFLMKQLEAPPVAYKILYVLIGVIALLLTIDFFFGGTGGPVIVR